MHVNTQRSKHTMPRVWVCRALASIAATAALIGLKLHTPASAEQPRCFRHKDGGLRCPQGSITCLPDALGKVSCAPTDGGVERNNFGEPLCGPGYCMRDWKGDVFCSKTPRGASDVDRYGEPVCTGGCVPGQAALCVKPTARRPASGLQSP